VPLFEKKPLTSFAANEGGRLNARYRLLCHASSIDPVKMKHLRTVVLLHTAMSCCTVPDRDIKFARKIDIDFASRSVTICVVYTSKCYKQVTKYLHTYNATMFALQNIANSVRTLEASLQNILVYMHVTCGFKNATEKRRFSKTWISHKQYNF
jgi:hypothetical protein